MYNSLPVFDSFPLPVVYRLLGNSEAAAEAERAERCKALAERALDLFDQSATPNETHLSKSERLALLIMLHRSGELLTYDDFEVVDRFGRSLSRRTLTGVREKLRACGYAHCPNGERGGMTLTDRGIERAKMIAG